MRACRTRGSAPERATRTNGTFPDNAMSSRQLVLAALVGCGTNHHPSTDADGATSIADAAPFTTGVSTLAGAGEAGLVDGDRSVARFNNPVNVAYGPDRRIYVADFDNGRIRAVDSGGNVTTIVAQAGFVRPFGLAFARDGTLFVSTDNDMNGAHNAMSGSVWSVDVHTGSATIAANAIGRPRGIAMLGDGRLALSDDLHQVVRLLDPRTGVVNELAGSWDVMGYADGVGTAARFSVPYGIAARSDGSLVVVDQGNNRLRLVGLDGTVTTLAGSDAGYADGALLHTKFSRPQAVVASTAGDLYVTDDNNFRVRLLHGDTVETLVGDGIGGYKDADSLLAAEVYGLEGIAVSADGNTVYLADGDRGDPLPYNRIRVVNLTH
jgi:sugar lactone lactonase YvrE